MMRDVVDVLHLSLYVLIPVVTALFVCWLVVKLVRFIAISTVEVVARWHARDLVMPDSLTGMFAISKRVLDDVPGHVIELNARRIDSQKTFAPVPSSISLSNTYAPRLANKVDGAGVQLADLPQLPLHIPGLWELFNEDRLPADRLLLGFKENQPEEPVTATFDQLMSVLVGGQTQSGKSTFVRGLLLQAVLQGGRFVVCDPHMRAGDKSLAASLMPLKERMALPPAGTEAEIVDSLRYVESVARARINGDPDRTALLVVVDELAALLQRSKIVDQLTNTLGLVTSEAAKVNVFAIGLSQSFQGRMFDTVIRNAFPSHVVFRNHKDNVRMQTGSSLVAGMAEGLRPGLGIFVDSIGNATRLLVPNATSKTIDNVAYTIGRGQALYEPQKQLPEVTSGPWSGPGSQNIGAAALDADDAGPDDDADVALTVDPIKMQLAYQMFVVEGKSRREVMQAVFGIDPKPGTRAFKTVSKELDEILRALARKNQG